MPRTSSTAAHHERVATAGPASQMALRALATANWLLVAVLVIIGVLFMRPGGAADPFWLVPVSIVGILLATVSGILVVRVPWHPVGWLLFVSGLFAGITVAFTALADHGINVDPGSVPGAVWLYWVGGLVVSPLFGLFVGFVLLLFPDGRLPSPRWWPVALLGALAITGGVIQSAFGPWSADVIAAQNPLLLTGPKADLVNLIGTVFTLLGFATLLCIAASLVIRYRAGSALERQQLKWFAYIAVITAPAAAASTVLSSESDGVLGSLSFAVGLIALLGMALLPVTIGIAILRYHLYDIDLVIRRTLVYVPITAILAGVFAASTVVFQRLFVVATGGTSDGAVIMSTLVIAAMFTPLKNTVQAAVDRRFGADADAARRLAAFVESLAEAPWAPDPARTIRVLLRMSLPVLHARGGAAWLAGRESESILSVGALGGDHVTVDVTADGGSVGRLELATDPLRPPTERELGIVRDAAETVAYALAAEHSVRHRREALATN